jgi:hypothetical protein
MTELVQLLREDGLVEAENAVIGEVDKSNEAFATTLEKFLGLQSSEDDQIVFSETKHSGGPDDGDYRPKGT